MRIPLIWLKDYVKTDKSASELAASFTQLGLMLDKPLDDSGVLDLEHRMDRADWLSLIGCARDLAAFEGVKLNLPKGHGRAGKKADPKDLIKVEIQTPYVRRFQTRVFRGIKVGPSPAWLVERLAAYGMESINNIVDITNYVMVEYGQPMHAQDIVKLKGHDITIRAAKKGETLTTLLGTTVKLEDDAFVLTSGGEVTVIGGIVGGKTTGVTESTVDIILDSGNYDSRIIRRVSRKLKILNESVSRNDKFLDPRLIDPALDRATALILELAGGTYYENDDYYPTPSQPKNQTLRLSRLKLLSGMDLTLETAKKILHSLEYAVVEEGSDSLTLEIPYFRTDVEVEDDLIADILRIHNYTNIPSMALSTPTPIDITSSIMRFEDRLRDLMLAMGAHEHITSSLTTLGSKSEQVKLANALSSDQNALRTNLVDGLTKVLSTYKKHKHINTTVFEIGKVFSKVNGQYLEHRHLTVLSSPEPMKINNLLATLMNALGITDYHITKQHEITIKDQVVGLLSTKYYQLTTDKLMPHTKSYTGIVSEFSHTTSLDLSLIAPTSVVYADIADCLRNLNGSWLSVVCKSFTKLKKGNNYLIEVTWAQTSVSLETEKNLILSTLKEKLNITSKS